MKELAKTLLKKIGVYHGLQSSYRHALSVVTRLQYRNSYRKYAGSGFVCNYCGATYARFVPEYPAKEIESAIYKNEVIAGYGENVYCPNCLSKNRERLVKAVIDHYIDFRDKKILHFSPEKHLYKYLKDKARVTTLDLEPGFYKSIDEAVLYGDATRLQFPDNSFEIVIANHILEHIPDDQEAMSEMHRVLRKGGVAILQAPWSKNLSTTIEEPGINDPEKQSKLYGQRDHVRIYTLPGYVARLGIAGFSVKVISADELSRFRGHAIQEGEVVVLGYKKE